jgi:hypothetical protein
MRDIILATATVLSLSLATSAEGSNGTTATSGIFVTIPGSSSFSSQVVGLDVYNDSKQDVGQIIDVAMNQDGQTQAYILSVGGIFGAGERYVAVNPSAIKVSFSDTDKAWHASMSATLDQLNAAPEYQYPSPSAAKACINILR